MSKRNLLSQDCGQKRPKYSFTFSAIPGHNQMDVLKKLDFLHFLRFKKCSKQTVEITKNFRHRLLLEFDYISSSEDDKLYGCSDTGYLEEENMLEFFWNEPVRFETESLFINRLTERALAWLKMFCATTKLTIDDVDINQVILDPETINELIKILKSKILNIDPTLPENVHDIMEISEFKNLEQTNFTCGTIFESDWLLLKAPEMHLLDIFITTSDINKFLKQWTRSERQIKEIEIEPIEEVDGLFEDLEPSVLWTPETDGSSSLAHLGLPAGKEVNSVHSMTREDGRKLLVFIYKPRESLVLFAREFEDLKDIDEWYFKIIEND